MRKSYFNTYRIAMKHGRLIFMMLGLIFLLSCTKTPVAPVSNAITFDTGVGVGIANTVALPVAMEGQPYTVAINPIGGNAPHVCESVPPNSFITGTIALGNNCVIAGNAPMLSPETTHGIYPVVFTIRDTNNVLSGPFNLALEVIKREQQGQTIPVQQGNRLVEEDSCELLRVSLCAQLGAS